MLKKIGTMIRTCTLLIALFALSGGPLWAEGPSECPEEAVGGQTGQPYTRVGQSLATETHSGSVGVSSSNGGCIIQLKDDTSWSEQFYVGYYENQVTHARVRVDCRTGQIF
jgi:hypothetical protein